MRRIVSGLLGGVLLPAQAVWAFQLSTMMWLRYYNVAQYLNMGEDFAPYDRTTEWHWAAVPGQADEIR